MPPPQVDDQLTRPPPGTPGPGTSGPIRDGLLHPLQIEWDADLVGGDPLTWPGYPALLAGMPPGDSVVTGRAAVDGARTDARYVVIAGRFSHVGGSMGAVHGEKVVRAYRRAALEKLPVVVVVSSGGARLQEGMVALAQLARTSAAARGHARAGLLSLAVLRSPSTGGVLASYASLTDLRAAQPGATVGLAGPRVVQIATGAPPPPYSHTAEAAHGRGLVDALLMPSQQPAWVETALGLRDQRLPGRSLPVAGRLGGGGSGGDTGAGGDADGGRDAVAGRDVGASGDAPADRDVQAGRDVEVAGGAWLEVLWARSRRRPSGVDHAARLCESWVELRGADPTMRAGLARIGDRRVVVIAHDRHTGTGRTAPGGFRLARRAVALAEHLRIPVLTLVDTPGADPGPAAESDGVAGEIAATLAAFMEASVPTVAVCVGEGGSAGALAIAACDRLLMLDHAVFSVIGPEGAATIVARDPAAAPRLAGKLRLSASDVVGLGIADAVVPEQDPAVVDAAIIAALDRATTGDRLRRLDAATIRWIR